MKKYVLATPHPRHEALRQQLNTQCPGQFTFICDYSELTAEKLAEIAPRYVFFPHWSRIIPHSVHTRFECVIFHMTDVPFGRGGSPLQNLVSRGFDETKMTALRCVGELDAGPVYLKRNLSLLGTAEEILLRASSLIGRMITDMVETEPTPEEQSGTPTVFARRTPSQSDAAGIDTLERLYDHIRMLDADDYPPAFINIGKFRLELSRVALRSGEIRADVRIVGNPDND